jgi:hypothetical protein
MRTDDRNGREAENRRILIALLLSLLLHLALLWRFSLLPAGSPNTRSGTLQVSLAGPAATLTTPVAPQAATAAEGLPAMQETTPAKDSARINAPIAAKLPAEATPSVPAANIAPSAPARDAAAQASGLPRSGSAGAAKSVEIEFELFSGANRQPMGKGRHLYVSENDRSFGVSIKQTPTADEAAQGASWQLEISGQIERHGLSSLVFQMQGAVPERLMALKEISANPSSAAGKSRSGRMPDGILDRQSLLYQFMLIPPANEGGKLWLSDGTTYGLYTYRIAGFEMLAIASIGSARTVKLVFTTADSPDIIELWLIPDKRYLPARVRHTDRLGVITEQVVVSLDTK